MNRILSKRAWNMLFLRKKLPEIENKPPKLTYSLSQTLFSAIDESSFWTLSNAVSPIKLLAVWQKNKLGAFCNNPWDDIHTQVVMLNNHLRGRGLLNLMLELWQNDIFLILMWNNLTMCQIMLLILKNRSYKNVHYDVAS